MRAFLLRSLPVSAAMGLSAAALYTTTVLFIATTGVSAACFSGSLRTPVAGYRDGDVWTAQVKLLWPGHPEPVALQIAGSVHHGHHAAPGPCCGNRFNLTVTAVAPSGFGVRVERTDNRTTKPGWGQQLLISWKAGAPTCPFPPSVFPSPPPPAPPTPPVHYLPSASRPPASQCAAVPPTARVNCAYWGVDRQQCEARGCCFGDAGEFTPSPDQQEPPPVFQHACFYARPAVPITKVHVVQSNHFDAGYHDIVGSQLQLYFDTYIPRAIRVGKTLKLLGGEERIRWLGQSWIFDLYLNCPPNAGLRCPGAAAVAEFKQAVREGMITWHGFPHNAELEVLSAAGLRNGINQSHALDDLFALPHKRVVSVRDVPGIPRGAIAPASDVGVDAFSVGANGRIVPPLLPPAFLWHDAATNKSAMVWFHAFGYGHDPAEFSRRRRAQKPLPPDGPSPQPPYMSSNHGPEYVIVPGCSEALVYDWRGMR
jgi:hypothetical protein